MADTLLTPILEDLRGCLCSHLEDETTGGGGCFCGMYPGTVAVADWCSCKGRSGKCGMAWVRLDRVFPSSKFPAVDNLAAKCSTMLAAVIELGVYRCIPTPNARGEMDPTALTNATLQQVEDMWSMFRAVACCEAITSREYALGTYTPRDGGDCGGGVLTVTVQLTR